MVWKLCPNWKSIFKLSLYDSVLSPWDPAGGREEMDGMKQTPLGLGPFFFLLLRNFTELEVSYKQRIFFQHVHIIFYFLLHEALP